MKDKTLILSFFLLLLSVQGVSQQASEFELSDGNYEELNFHMFNPNYNGDPVEEGLITEDQAAIIFEDMNFCTFNSNIDAGRTWSSCELVEASDIQLLQKLVDDTTPNYDFASGNDNPNIGDGGGSLDVRFEDLPSSIDVRDSPQFKVVGTDTRDRSRIPEGDFLSSGNVRFISSPGYMDGDSRLVDEKSCNNVDPDKCSINLNRNNGDGRFTFLSPGQNSLTAIAEDGAGTSVQASENVDVGVGQPPNEDNLDRFSVEGGFGDSWNPVLNERWKDSTQADGGNERLAFVQDEYDNIVIDTGDSYLYGGAFVQKQSYDQDVDGKKIQVGYRIDVQDDDNENTNRFGVVTVDEDGNFRNSTIGPERFDTKDEGGINQNEKTYTLTHDLSSSTDDIRVGVFFNGDALQDGEGLGNSMRVIIEKIDIIEDQRDVSFEKRSPNFEENPLVRGQSSSFNFKVNDNFDQLDLAKINVSSELNRQDAPESNERESRICEQGSPSFCYSSGPDFTPQKLGEYIFTVGIETKTGKYFSKEFSAVSHAGDQLSLGNIDFNDNGEARFKVEDNFEGGDLSGKNFTAEKLVGSGQRRQFRIIESNRCRPDGDSSVCYVPRTAQEFESGTFRLKLLTEEDELLINQTVEQVDIS